MRIILRITILFILAASAAYVARAQFIPDPVSLVATPSSPSPRETVLIEASTPTFDQESAFFSWTVNGNLRPEFSGQGKNQITLTAGEIGSTLQVNVEASAPQGTGGTASLSVRVSDLALTWLAETYTPKWYKGKALPVQNSVVNIVAIPRFVIGGREIPSRNLIYRWGLDDEDRALSGVGSQVFQVQISIMPKISHHIRVTIEDPGGQIRREGELFIVPVRPRLALYPSSPLGGIEFRSSPAFYQTATRGILDFQAEPFFFPVKSKKELPFRWTVGGVEGRGTPGEENLLSINTGERPVPLIPLSVSVQIPDSVISAISNTLTLLLP
mgnify:FL=1